MYVKWRSLSSFGFAFWALITITDLLGDCTWKQHSEHVSVILNSIQMPAPVKLSSPTWYSLIWNCLAFLAAILFCSFLKSVTWLIWKIVGLTSNRKSSDTEVIFKNDQFGPITDKETATLLCELSDLKKAKSEMKQQLLIAQKKSLDANQQMEEYRLEALMMREKLSRTSNSLKENLMHKDKSCFTQELAERKTINLEAHLREVSKDRDNLRSKLCNLEKKYAILEERVQEYENNNESGSNDDGSSCDSPVKEEKTESSNEAEVDMSVFQKKILELQQNMKTIKSLKSSSKVSIDLDEISDYFPVKDTYKPPEIKLKYNPNQFQILTPKVGNIMRMSGKVSDNTTGSSSDESPPSRLISNTVEFQNFLKNLSSSSNINYHGIL